MTLQDNENMNSKEGPSKERSLGAKHRSNKWVPCEWERRCAEIPTESWGPAVRLTCQPGVSDTGEHKVSCKLFSSGLCRALPRNAGSQAGDWRELKQQGCGQGQASVSENLSQAGCWPAEMAESWQYSTNPDSDPAPLAAPQVRGATSPARECET